MVRHTRGPGSRPGHPAPYPPAGGDNGTNITRVSPASVEYTGDVADVERALFGLAEIADLCHYPRTNKARLRKILPPPDYELHMGPIWKLETVKAWLERYPIWRQG